MSRRTQRRRMKVTFDPASGVRDAVILVLVWHAFGWQALLWGLLAVAVAILVLVVPVLLLTDRGAR